VHREDAEIADGMDAKDGELHVRANSTQIRWSRIFIYCSKFQSSPSDLKHGSSSNPGATDARVENGDLYILFYARDSSACPKVNGVLRRRSPKIDVNWSSGRSFPS
jgi:hypothetical protein